MPAEQRSTEEPERIRLQLVLARAGVASRRTAAEWIAAGRVTVNGHPVTTPGAKIDPQEDTVTVDGRPLPSAPPLRYYALHKPTDVISSVGDARGRRTVVDFLPAEAVRCVPIGRLDRDSEGLLLLSNDGPLIHTLLHPSHALPREYLAEIEGRASNADLQRLHEGLPLADRTVGRAQSRRSKRPGASPRRGRPGTSWIVLTLHQGRKREVRQLCAAIGHPVIRLIRVRFGPIRLGDLPSGHIRPLSEREVHLLQRAPRHGPPVPQAKPSILTTMANADRQPDSPLIIAIDGPVASGKSALGQRLADLLGWRFLDTGIMYRALTWLALERGTDLQDATELTTLAQETEMTISPAPTRGGEPTTIQLDGQDATPSLRQAPVEASVSTVAAVSGVRRRMVERQQAEAERGMVIMVGRDIGTVVVPNAPVKIFLTASAKVRARRRTDELREYQQSVQEADVLADVKRRDQRDAGRTVSPLRPAADALELDTSDLTLDEAVEAALRIVADRIPNVVRT